MKIRRGGKVKFIPEQRAERIASRLGRVPALMDLSGLLSIRVVPRAQARPGYCFFFICKPEGVVPRAQARPGVASFFVCQQPNRVVPRESLLNFGSGFFRPCVLQ